MALNQLTTINKPVDKPIKTLSTSCPASWSLSKNRLINYFNKL